MEGFTIILLIGWLLLVAALAGMYVLDRRVKEAADRRAAAAQKSSEK